MKQALNLATVAASVLPQLAHLGQPLALYAFGSRVSGHATDESDLDLAVLWATYANPLQLWQLASDLATQWQIEVDLVDLRAASTVLQFQILTTGERLWADPLADSFEAFIYSEKDWLDQQRSALLADIQRSGTIYGR